MLKPSENLLKTIVCLPVAEHVELAWFNFSISLIHARQVNFGVEVNLWSLAWIVGSTNNAKEINTVVKVGVDGANNSTIPISESFIFGYEKLVSGNMVYHYRVHKKCFDLRDLFLLFRALRKGGIAWAL